MSAVTIRDMRAEDVAEAWAIECASFPDPWTPRVFAEELAAPDRAYVVAEDDGAVVGFSGTMVVGEDAHLMNLAVDESRRGQGIGRRLLEAVADRAMGLGAGRITLEVRPENAVGRRALPFGRAGRGRRATRILSGRAGRDDHVGRTAARHSRRGRWRTPAS